MRGWQDVEDAAPGRTTEGGQSTGSDLERRYWAALAMYALLAALAWFTMDPGKVPVMGRPVEMRLLPLLVLGGLALRTVLALKAEKIRRGGGDGDGRGGR